MIKFSDYKTQIYLHEKRFSLTAAILKPSANHFSLFLENPDNSVNKWYHFDDLLNQRNLVPINKLAKLLTEFSPYILIYVEKK